MAVSETDSPREISRTWMAHEPCPGLLLPLSPSCCPRDSLLDEDRNDIPRTNVGYRVLIKPLLSAGENLLLDNYSQREGKIT